MYGAHCAKKRSEIISDNARFIYSHLFDGCSFGGELKDPDVRVAARAALSTILAPLTGFAVDVGVSAHELQVMCRVAAVNVAADRQRASNLRVSISGIAAITGIPRAEVSRILRSKKMGGQLEIGQRPHAINKILSVWNEHPNFTNRSGRPADLKIYGPGSTFETLVNRHGGGLPIRAVIDELIRTGSVEIINPQKLKLKSPISMDRGFNSGEIKIFSRRVAQLIESMLDRFRKPDSQLILSNIEGDIFEDGALPIFRKEVISSSDDLLTGLRESLFRTARNGHKKKSKVKSKRIRVMVLYQEIPNPDRERVVSIQRRNFRRSVR
jgi:hypothetical protein